MQKPSSRTCINASIVDLGLLRPDNVMDVYLRVKHEKKCICFLNHYGFSTDIMYHKIGNVIEEKRHNLFNSLTSTLILILE